MERYNQSNERLLVGAIKRPITPTIQGRHVFIAGDDRIREATDIHDELWASAVAIRCAENTLVLIALDLLGFPQEYTTAVREHAIAQGLPAENLIVTCTRNHAGPDVIGHWSRGWLGSGLNLRYVHFLRRELVEIIRLATEELQPAQMYLARQHVPDPCGGPELRELSVLQFRTAAERPMATVVNYPLVPQVLDQSNTSISADFVHWLYADLEGQDNRGQVTLFVCAEATERPGPAFPEHSLAEAERVGRGLAQAVRSALETASATDVDQLRIWQKPMMLPQDRAATRWRKSTKPSGNGSKHRRESRIGLIELGPARMAAVPGLLAPQIGLQVRKMLDAPYRFVLGMSNDDVGFVPSQERPSTPGKPASLVGVRVLDELDQLLLRAQSPEPANGNG
jgi:hypothetical protein